MIFNKWIDVYDSTIAVAEKPPGSLPKLRILISFEGKCRFEVRSRPHTSANGKRFFIRIEMHKNI